MTLHVFFVLLDSCQSRVWLGWASLGRRKGLISFIDCLCPALRDGRKRRVICNGEQKRESPCLIPPLSSTFELAMDKKDSRAPEGICLGSSLIAISITISQLISMMMIIFHQVFISFQNTNTDYESEVNSFKVISVNNFEGNVRNHCLVVPSGILISVWHEPFDVVI